MKRLKTIFATMVLCFGFMATMASCSDDDENDEPDVPAAQEVVGTYAGDMTCSVMGQESTFEDMTVTVTAVDDASVSLSISEFGNPPMQVSGITVEGMQVSGADGDYTLASTEFSGTANGGKAYSGVAQGNVAGNTLTLKFNLQYGAMPMPMICSVTAYKK